MFRIKTALLLLPEWAEVKYSGSDLVGKSNTHDKSTTRGKLSRGTSYTPSNRGPGILQGRGHVSEERGMMGTKPRTQERMTVLYSGYFRNVFEMYASRSYFRRLEGRL